MFSLKEPRILVGFFLNFLKKVLLKWEKSLNPTSEAISPIGKSVVSKKIFDLFNRISLMYSAEACPVNAFIFLCNFERLIPDRKSTRLNSSHG